MGTFAPSTKGSHVFTPTLTRTTLAAIGAAVIGLVTLTPASADVTNGDFEAGETGWFNYGFSSVQFDGTQFCGEVPGGTTNPWDVAMGQNDLTLPAGDYVFSFDASGDGPVRAIVAQNGGAYTVYSEVNAIPGDDVAHYEVGFTLDEDATDPQVAFQVGGASSGFTFCVDNVSVSAPGTEFVTNGTFDDGLDPFAQYGFTSTTTAAGNFCASVPAATANPWDVGLVYNNLVLPAGDYTLSFDASGSGPVRALVGVNGPPYTVYTEINAVPGSGDSYTSSFTLDEEVGNLQVAFQVGGAADAWELCVDNVSLVGGAELPRYTPETGPRVKVNQVGYLTDGPKNATLVTDATEPLSWSLVNDAGVDVATGTTTPLGVDDSAGANVHGIDFSTTSAAGTYTLQADGETSETFVIGDDLYEQLRLDALNYFYLARSGTPIEASIVGDDYAREAGHVSSPADGAVNQGDLDVPCQPVEESETVYGEPWTCDYTLDVVGGWYDAGDHGKYVVNGGIATAQLLGAFERTKTAGSTDAGALGDNTLNLPEHDNGVPDVLDEARWELEFMLSMQVPEGEQYAGMVHHKIHDYGWTGLPLLPVNDGQQRYLHRPSTAATLNLAATAAQGARLFAPYDSAFAAELLSAAKSTWNAALANPQVYAPAADGNNGGGPYNDDDVSDEFYWAAAELFLTTGDQQYADFLLASPVQERNSFPVTAFSWDKLDAIAKMNLATVPNEFSARDDVVDQVIAGADAITAVQQSQEFGLALPDDAFVWGSNSQVLNNIVVLGVAHDLTGAAPYLDAAVESMDYLLGRNALGLSYITGWGDVYSQNQHSRWFSAQLNPDLPHPPAGSVAGGPNTDVGTWDPTLANLYPDADCAPQWCYVDHIQSWSTNEITVNWNSALSWAASFLADQDSGATASAPRCEVDYIVHGTWPGGYNTQIWIKNTGQTAITGWKLSWAYPGDDEVTSRAWSAQWSQQGATVTAENYPWNATIKPGKRTTIGFIGDPGGLREASPEQFWLNGQACAVK